MQHQARLKSCLSYTARCSQAALQGFLLLCCRTRHEVALHVTREGHTFRHATRGPNQIRQWGHSLEYARFTLKLHHMKHKVLT